MRRRVVRVGVSVTLLGALAYWLDTGALAARLAALDARWVLVAVALSLPQMALLAFRWRLTAERLGLELPFRVALREYYLATFLNQVLPGGVMGDVSRAWRHGRAGGQARVGPAARAVILERGSAQVAMCAVAALSLGALPFLFDPAPRTLTVAAAGAAGILAAALLLGPRWRPLAAGRLATLRRDVRTALLAADALGAQLATALLVVGSYLATYLVAARAVGVETPAWTLLPLVAPVLLSMLIPATVAGWGVREAAAAALWAAVGLSAVDGMAISAAYGFVVLLSSLPGALVLLSAGRGQTGRLRPGAPSGSAGAAPDPGIRSAAG